MPKIEQDLKILDVHNQTSFQELEQKANITAPGSGELIRLKNGLAGLLASTKVVYPKHIRTLLQDYIDIVIPSNL